MERIRNGKRVKPLLAGKVEDLYALPYPVLATPKIDGIRCLTAEGGLGLSRKLLAIPNAHIQAELQKLGIEGLDGELWIVGAEDFGTVSSGVMRESGAPAFEYHVFDVWDHDGTYVERLEELARRVDAVGRPSWLKILLPVPIGDPAELEAYEAECLDAGHEGVMVRRPSGPYKYGRSTNREATLLKLKRFEDDEAVVIGLQEEQHNENVLTADELGHAKRSHAKAGMTGKGTLGALVCRHASGIEFNVGTGFTAKQRAELWAEGEAVLGRIAKYRHQGHGAKDGGKPRCPSFQGFRDPRDL